MSKTNKNVEISDNKSETRESKVLINEDKEAVVISRNEVRLVGTIVQTFVPNEKVAIITIATGQGVYSQYPKVTWYGTSAKMIAKDFPPGNKKYQKVCIEGYVQTSKRVIGGETRYYQNIIGKKLEFAPKLLETQLGVEAGRRYVQDVNSVVIIGEIVNKYDFFSAKGTPDGKPLGTVLTIRTQEFGRYNFPKVTFFKQSKFAMNTNTGDIVAIYGMYQTSKQEKNGEIIHHENIVGEDIDYIHD
jgi:hypothetical protein